MTETHPATKLPLPSPEPTVSLSRVTKAIRRRHQADVAGHKEGGYLCYINNDPQVTDPSPGTLRLDFYSSETDGDRDREISNRLPYAVLCAHREIGARAPIGITSLWSPIALRAGGLSLHNRTLHYLRDVTSGKRLNIARPARLFSPCSLNIARQHEVKCYLYTVVFILVGD